MSSTTATPRLGPAELLQAAQQLSNEELETFVSEVLLERGRRRTPCLNQTESELFAVINQGRSEAEQRQFDELKKRLDAGLITAEEREELLRLTDEAELRQARRLEALMALAQHRGVSVRDLMIQLGLKTPSHE